MAKTKEEIQKLVEKNYQTVQVQELSVYDKAEELHNGFTKNVKEIEKQYKTELKNVEKEEKELTATTASKIAEVEQKLQKHIDEVAVKKQTAQVLYDTTLQANVEKEKGLLADKVKETEGIQKAFDKALKDLDKQLKKDIDASNKQIAAIQEKGVKDQATFEQKINDLKAKYEAKVESLQEKQVLKIQKLTESSNSKVETLQAVIVTEKEAVTKKAAIKQAAYEEELEEINEKIAFEKGEFDRKYENIKDSAEKRIAVREKHLQRAIQDNDKRSEKQHKKDIAKFQKEADHDLVVLEKNYKQQSQVSADYRIKYMKDYLEEVAANERKFAEFREQKQFEIDTLLIQLTHDTEHTKLEYEQLLAEELDKFNNDYAQTREKQETVRHQQELDEQKELHAQAMFHIECERAVKVAQEEHKDHLETKAKEERVIQLEKLAEDALAKNTLDETNTRLDGEILVAEVEKTHDIDLIHLNEKIRLHTLQDKRHQAQKNEYLAYQKQVQPVFVHRSKEIQKYEESEINNRLAIKLAFYDKEQNVLDKDYEILVQKVEQTYLEESTFFEQHIQAIAGEQQEALQTYIDEKEAKAVELKAKYESIDARKERKIAETEYEDFMNRYQTERQQKEQQLNQSVGVYKKALIDAQDRKAKALKDVKELYEKATLRVNRMKDTLKTDAQNELENATKLVTETEENFNQFNLQIASRNQQQTDANNNYVQAQIQSENEAIKEVHAVLEHSRELLGNNLNTSLSNNATERQAILSNKTASINQEEATLEAFRTQIRTALQSIKDETSQLVLQQNNSFAAKSSDITTRLNEELSLIKSTLSNQVADFNQTSADITKRINAIKAVLDTEQKRVKKEFDDRLKEDFGKIQTDLQTKLAAVQ